MRPRRASRASLAREEHEEEELEQTEEPPRRQGRRAGKGKQLFMDQAGSIPSRHRAFASYWQPNSLMRTKLTPQPPAFSAVKAASFVAFAVAFPKATPVPNIESAAAPVEEDEDCMPGAEDEDEGSGRSLRPRVGTRRSLGDDEAGPSKKRGRRGAAAAGVKPEPAGGCRLAR